MTGDFASAAMVQVIVAGMHRLGLTPPAVGPVKDALVALRLKRELVGAAQAQGGLSALPRLGSGIDALRGQPLHQALASSRSPADFLARWARMERYIHSRHRVRVLPQEGSFLLEHQSLGAEPPLPQESLVVLGVVAAALEEIGMGPVQVHCAGVKVYPGATESDLQALAHAGALRHWTLRSGAAKAKTRAPPSPPVVQAPAGWPAAAGRLLQHLAADLASAPLLPEAAGSLGTSARTLQRELSLHGLSYSQVLARARCDAAASQLLHSQASLAEIGFLCGFSDQAHFGRSFRRSVALTPAAFRREFRARD